MGKGREGERKMGKERGREKEREWGKILEFKHSREENPHQTHQRITKPLLVRLSKPKRATKRSKRRQV